MPVRRRREQRGKGARRQTVTVVEITPPDEAGPWLISREEVDELPQVPKFEDRLRITEKCCKEFLRNRGLPHSRDERPDLIPFVREKYGHNSDEALAAEILVHLDLLFHNIENSACAWDVAFLALEIGRLAERLDAGGRTRIFEDAGRAGAEARHGPIGSKPAGYARAVRELLERDPGLKLDSAFATVAATHSVSFSTVKKAYYRKKQVR
jgi:hypothetical protein